MNCIRPYLSLCLLALPLFLGAQAELNLYFASGRADLDDKAKQALRDFAQKIKPEGRLQLSPFSDDQGQEAANLRLARQRGQNAQAYLRELLPAQTALDWQLDEARILPLAAGLDPAQSRALNRRVSLRYEPLPSLSMSERLREFQDKAKQRRHFDCERDIVFAGQKGGRIEIPAHSLVYPDGRPAQGQVEITLIEAYDFVDMILQNLQTLADNGEVLETGGMLYVQASDAQGQALELRPGAMMRVSMPGAKPLPQGMKVFSAERQDPAQPLVWQLEDQAFEGQANPNRPIERQFGFPQADLAALPRLPRRATSQRRPQPPRLLLIPNTPPDMDELRLNSPRRAQESEGDYDKRLKVVYNTKRKAYEERERQNDLSRQQYQRDSLKYRDALAKFQPNQPEVLKQLPELRRVATNWAAYEAQNIAILTFMNDPNQTQALKTDFLVQLPQWAEQAKNLDLPQLQARFLGLAQGLDSIYKSGNWLSEKQLRKQNGELQYIQENLEQALRPLYPELSLVGYQNRCANLASLGLSADDETDMLYNLEAFWIELPQLQERLAKIYHHQANAEQYALLQQIYAEIKQAQDELFQERKARGLLSDAELKAEFLYLGLSPRLGWINCDRFPENPGPRTDMLVQYPSKALIEDSETWFAVLPDINGLLNLNLVKQGFSSERIPQSARVKLVGMRVNANREMEVAIHEGYASEFKQFAEPQFKPGDLAQFREQIQH